MKYTYTKNGAQVTMDTSKNFLNATVTKNGEVCKINLSRLQSLETEDYTRPYMAGGGEAIRGDYIVNYDFKIAVGDSNKQKKEELFVKHFDDYEIPDYNETLEHGIPANEYEMLCQNFDPSVKKFFLDYILNADQLKNMSNNIYQKLDKFGNTLP